ncbi:MAG: MarR family transcriptional regulator [Bacteroidota bacterium]
MELQVAKDKFIQAWGTLGSSWGINRTMAQVHALLLISEEPQSAENIMEALKISRGNANMNVRALIDWGLVFKELKPGERKEYFVAEKNMWDIVRQIIVQRKKKELEPIVKILNEVSDVEDDSEEAQNFLKVVQEFKLFASKADTTLDNLIKADQHWFVGTFMNMIK